MGEPDSPESLAPLLVAVVEEAASVPAEMLTDYAQPLELNRSAFSIPSDTQDLRKNKVIFILLGRLAKSEKVTEEIHRSNMCDASPAAVSRKSIA